MQGINELVTRLLESASTAPSPGAPPEFDIMEMPLEGVAAFWLSVKKTLETKRRDENFLRHEAQHTKEPYIRYLLELAASSFAPEEAHELAEVRAATVLEDLGRKYTLMSIALLGMAASENPQKVMVRFLSKFPIPPILERQVFEVADLMLQHLDDPKFNKKKFLRIDHKQKIESLIINLIFYCKLARKQGIPAVLEYREHLLSPYFRDGLELVADGFDGEFIKYRLNLVKREVLAATERKMRLCAAMMAAIKEGIPYADLYLVAKAYLG
jgi:hypothetical protein